LDNITTILWKDPIFLDLLLDFCNNTFESVSPPSAWFIGGIIPVPKKGDLTLASNYRGITLMPIAAKIYNKLLLNRIVPVLDPLLRKKWFPKRERHLFPNLIHSSYFGGNEKTQQRSLHLFC